METPDVSTAGVCGEKQLVSERVGKWVTDVLDLTALLATVMAVTGMAC